MTDQTIRLSDTEREAAAADLGEHFAQGRLTADEHAERLEQVWGAKTRGEVAPIFRDLPSPYAAVASAPSVAHEDRYWNAGLRPFRRGVPGPEPGVKLERRLDQRRLEALGEVGLKDVARDDVLAHSRHGVEIAAVREGGAEPDRLGAIDALDRVGRRLGQAAGVRRRAIARRRPGKPRRPTWASTSPRVG